MSGSCARRVIPSKRRGADTAMCLCVGRWTHDPPEQVCVRDHSALLAQGVSWSTAPGGSAPDDRPIHPLMGRAALPGPLATPKVISAASQKARSSRAQPR
jgi:hypothetical protein